MDDPITPCRFRQFIERRLTLVEQLRDGVVLSDSLGLIKKPNKEFVVFAGRIKCRGDIEIKVNEHLHIIMIPPRQSYPNGLISLETYEYHVCTSGGTNICRFDGLHLQDGPDRFVDPDDENHSHHAHKHVHLYDPSIEGGKKIQRTWPGETPTLIGLVKNVHDWRYNQTTQIAGRTTRIRPF